MLIVRKALCLDRDGTVIEDKNYLDDPARVELTQNCVEGLRLFQSFEFVIFIVTNQSGISRGYFSEDQMQIVNSRMCDLLSEQGISIEETVFCPHTTADNCVCRKPKVGMLETLDAKYDIDWDASFFVGDKDIDLLCGRAMNMNSILVTTGKGSSFEQYAHTNRFVVKRDLLECAHYYRDLYL